jgi:hypothetical protein
VQTRAAAEGGIGSDPDVVLLEHLLGHVDHW